MLKKKMTFLCSVAVFITFMVFSGLTFAGNLEPSASPAPTMRTLEELHPSWNKTIQITSERFEPAIPFTFLGQTVYSGYLDKETGLVWEKAQDATFVGEWDDAIRYCYNKNVGNRKGWRLPTVEELASLIDPLQGNPSLPTGHPFENVRNGTYWSSTTRPGDTSQVMTANLGDGFVGFFPKTTLPTGAWCVRGGHGHDGQ